MSIQQMDHDIYVTTLERDNKRLRAENELLKRQLSAVLERGHQEINYQPGDIVDESGLRVGNAPEITK